MHDAYSWNSCYTQAATELTLSCMHTDPADESHNNNTAGSQCPASSLTSDPDIGTIPAHNICIHGCTLWHDLCVLLCVWATVCVHTNESTFIMLSHTLTVTWWAMAELFILLRVHALTLLEFFLHTHIGKVMHDCMHTWKLMHRQGQCVNMRKSHVDTWSSGQGMHKQTCCIHICRFKDSTGQAGLCTYIHM
jgi:hypothetical protein